MVIERTIERRAAGAAWPTSDAAAARERATTREVSLAGAVRVTGRQDNLLKKWVRDSAAYFADPDQDGPRPPELFWPGEVRRLPHIRRGTAEGYAIALAALERVHKARGGMYWAPEAATVAVVPPTIAEELRALHAEVARLRGQVAQVARRTAGIPAADAAGAPPDPVAGVGARKADVVARGLAPTVPMRRPAPAAAPPAPPAPRRPSRRRVEAAPEHLAERLALIATLKVMADLPNGWRLLEPPPGYLSANAWAEDHGFDRMSASLWLSRIKRQSNPIRALYAEGVRFYLKPDLTCTYLFDERACEDFGRYLAENERYTVCDRGAACPSCRHAIAWRRLSGPADGPAGRPPDAPPNAGDRRPVAAG